MTPLSQKAYYLYRGESKTRRRFCCGGFPPAVDTTDARLILQYAVEKIDSF